MEVETGCHGANVGNSVPSDKASLFEKLVVDTLMKHDQRVWVY